MHVAKRTGDQHGRPIGVACGRPLIEQGQDAEGGLGSVFRLGAAVAGLAETREPIRGVAHPPFGRLPIVQPTSRAMARVAAPSAAIKTIRALKRRRYSVFVQRIRLSSAVRSSLVNIIGVASHMLLMQP